MPKPKKPMASTAEQAAKTTRDPLASSEGRAWLANQLADAERAERFGPGGQGWVYNETKRAEVTERADFLRALVRLLPPLQ